MFRSRFGYKFGLNACGFRQMKQQIGWLMQLSVLGILPGMIVYDYTYGFNKLEMPAALITCTAIFMAGTNLRGK